MDRSSIHKSLKPLHVDAREFERVEAMSKQLSEAVSAISRRIDRSLSSPEATVGPLDRSSLEARVRSAYRARRERDRLFPAGIFADPSWDMLLDIYASELAGQPTSVSSACIASNVPATTALRFIRTLTANGVIVRKSDPLDARRVYIELTDKTRKAMRSMFDVPRANGLGAW